MTREENKELKDFPLLDKIQQNLSIHDEQTEVNHFEMIQKHAQMKRNRSLRKIRAIAAVFIGFVMIYSLFPSNVINENHELSIAEINLFFEEEIYSFESTELLQTEDLNPINISIESSLEETEIYSDDFLFDELN